MRIPPWIERVAGWLWLGMGGAHVGPRPVPRVPADAPQPPARRKGVEPEAVAKGTVPTPFSQGAATVGRRAGLELEGLSAQGQGNGGLP